MSDQPFTMEQMQICKGILGMVETGKFGGKAALLVVLEDGAGITFGRHQTTENGGGLWKLIFKHYLTRNDLRAKIVLEDGSEHSPKKFFEPYRDKIYRRGREYIGRKNAVTKDDTFKDMLVQAAKDDPAMDVAQKNMFHIEYFRPALALAADFDVDIALGLLIVYDMCIHSGPDYAEKLITRFDENWEEPAHLAGLDDVTDEQQLELDRAWVSDLIKWRHNWLSTFTSKRKGHQKVVRGTAYRTGSYLRLLEAENWDLKAPFIYVMDGKPYGHSWTHKVEINEERLKDVG